MKIGIYVLSKNTKRSYGKNDSYDKRINAGMYLVKDILQRAGFQDIKYTSNVDVATFDVILFSVTSDCDWYEFIAERAQWSKGNYKVIVGGQGVLNVRPFLQWVDYFVLGRAEGVIVDLINNIDSYDSEHVVNSRTFSDSKEYRLAQAVKIYPHNIELDNGDLYHEDIVGCNHKCFFCGYTWHRKNVNDSEFSYSGLWNGGKDRERAMIDMANGVAVDLVKLRTTAIDGLSERLRFMVNKKITRDMLRDFLVKLAGCSKPHQVKFYNIIGYPTETENDWFEFLEDIKIADYEFKKQEKQTSILLHSTPFRPMPATPLACHPMSYHNYRGEIARVLGVGLKGNIFYQGNAMWAVEGMGTESLPTVTKSAIVWRGTEKDADNFLKVARSRKFNNANSQVKQLTLEKYFDVKTLFGAFTPDTLPTKYLKTYANIDKMWQRKTPGI